MARSGVLVVDKPMGPSSAQVVARVKRALGADKVGHTGTLDPMATGVLPVVVGEATKLAGMLLAEDKVYEGELELGIETDTLDITGTVTARADAGHVTRDGLVEAIAGHTGRITQVPPRVSALKQGGRPLYELTRAGIEVEPPPREVEIRVFELLSFDPPRARFRVDCSKGTYVRSLVRDVGRTLGTLGTLTALRRTRSGAFGLEQAVPLDDVGPDSLLVSPSEAICHLPVVVIDAAAAARVRQGQRLRAPAEIAADTQVRVLGPDAQLVAVATVRDGALTYDRVIHPHAA